MSETFEVLLLDAGKRLDALVSEKSGATRSQATRWVEEGRVRVNRQTVGKSFRPKEGDVVEYDKPEAQPSKSEAQKIPLDIVYEDRDIIVINKPVGMVVHPAPGNPDNTLVNALLYHCGDSLSGIGGEKRPGIVHRIDKETSGLLVAAKNDAAHLSLAAQIKEHGVHRIYYALVVGNLSSDEGTIDRPIGRHPVQRKRMAVISDPVHRSRSAVTHYKVMERFGDFTFVRCELETGRTHQIRVHMASIGHPLAGDDLYGGNRTRFEKENKQWITGQCLHAGELRLKHPMTGEDMVFRADLPAEMTALIEKLRKKGAAAHS